MITVNKKFRMRVLMFFLLLSCVQNLSLISFGTISIKYYYVFAIFCFPLLLRKRITMPPRIILIFFCMVFISSFWGMIVGFGFNSFVIKFLFAFYSLILIMNVGNDFTESEWIEIVKKVFIFIMILIWIKNFMQINSIISFLRSPYGHPSITYIFGGGANLEATFMAMAIPVFYKDKKLWPYVVLATLLSVIYASRTALIVNVLCIAWIGLIYLDKKSWEKIFVACVFLLFAISYLYNAGALDYIINRFANIGSEAGSIGRLNMWIYALEIIREYPLGCGIGNSVNALEEMLSTSYSENNFHNVYLQMFIDLGIIGGSLYIITVISFVIKNIIHIKDNPIVVVLFLYIITSMLQFAGAEVIVYCFLGIYLQQIRLKKLDGLTKKG